MIEREDSLGFQIVRHNKTYKMILPQCRNNQYINLTFLCQHNRIHAPIVIRIQKNLSLLLNKLLA